MRFVTAERKTMTTREQYCEDRSFSGGYFENQVLYRMCFDHARHDDSYVTAGKIIVIGRVYAASPERGAGIAVAEGMPLVQRIAKRMRETCLDEQLDAVDFAARFSDSIAQTVVNVHGIVNEAVGNAIREHNGREDEAFGRESFASKYLHFHRPNAFPILDRYSREGVKRTFPRYRTGRLTTARGNTGYARFCELVLRFVGQPGTPSNWTPRSIDAALMSIGARPNYRA